MQAVGQDDVGALFDSFKSYTTSEPKKSLLWYSGSYTITGRRRLIVGFSHTADGPAVVQGNHLSTIIE
ncbi:hypothetical protein [Neisseria weixii]|uniref:hypothetical protein n=1 Tax=Neisseria weixii TaxID=1853276 RepID=UPI0012FDF588|nr:hypothetical protein [Neisseria weixii]